MDEILIEIPGVGEVAFPASMSQDEIASQARRLFNEARGMVYEEAPGISISYPTDERQQPPQEPVQRTTAEELTRQLGLTGRAGATGVSSLPLMAGDALNALINSIAGTNLPPATQSFQNLMTAIGVPQPETKTERISGDIASAMAGVGGTTKLIQALTPRPSVNLLNQPSVTAPLTENLGAQTTGAVAGTTAASLGREEGASPLAQMGLGLMVGSIAPSTMSAATGRTVEAGKRIVQPFTEAGREKITGEVLRNLARNPDEAAIAAQQYQPQIPGYQPTTAQATRDVGLISAETPIRALDTTGRFAQQAAEANRARMEILNRLAKDNDALLAAIAKRNEVTSPMREAAFAKSNVDPATFRSAVDLVVGNTAKQILASPVGKRTTVEVVIKDALKDVKRANSARDLYEIRKDLRAKAEGLIDSSDRKGPNQSAYKAAAPQLNEIIRAVDNIIESTAPGYGDYLRTYRQASVGIERLQGAQDVRNRVLSTIPDPVNVGEFLISQPNFARTIRSIKNDKDFKGLSKSQVNTLEKIAKDLDEGVLPRAAKVPGSDTFKNMSTANVIGGIIGKQMFGEMSPALQKIAAPMNWLFNGTDDRIRELLVDAMLDPKLASRLMAQAKDTTMESLSRELQRKAINMGYGAAFGLGQ